MMSVMVNINYKKITELYKKTCFPFPCICRCRHFTALVYLRCLHLDSCVRDRPYHPRRQQYCKPSCSFDEHLHHSFLLTNKDVLAYKAPNYFMFLCWRWLVFSAHKPS